MYFIFCEELKIAFKRKLLKNIPGFTFLHFNTTEHHGKQTSAVSWTFHMFKITIQITSLGLDMSAKLFCMKNIDSNLDGTNVPIVGKD